MADDALTPKKGEVLDLKSASFRSEKTGRYTRKIDVRSIIDSVNVLKPTTEKIKVSALKLKDEVVGFRTLMLKQSEKPARPSAVIEEKPGTSSIKEGLEDLSSSSFNLAKLALLIPLLFNETTRNIVSGFFEGVLEGLGLSQEAIKIMKSIAAGAVMAFKLYLGYKVFKSIFDVFMAFKKLADATGILGLLIGKKNSEMVAAGPEADLEKDNLRKQTKKQRGLIKTLKTRAKVFMRKIKQFMNFKKIAIGALRAVKGIVRVVKTATAWTGIGYLIGAAIDAGIGTLIDYYTAEEENEESSAAGFEKVGKLFADNFIQSLTFGAVNLEDLKSMINGLIDAGIKKKIVPEWLGNKLKFDTSKSATPEKKASATGTTPAVEVGSKDISQKKAAAASSRPTPSATGAVPNTPSMTSAAAAPGGSQSSTGSPTGTASVAMEPSQSGLGQSLQDTSEETLSAKKILSGNVTNVVNVDNSQNLHTEESKTTNFSPGVIFNSTVGA